MISAQFLMNRNDSSVQSYTLSTKVCNSTHRPDTFWMVFLILDWYSFDDNDGSFLWGYFVSDFFQVHAIFIFPSREVRRSYG